jgi:hypothetical protein
MLVMLDGALISPVSQKLSPLKEWRSKEHFLSNPARDGPMVRDLTPPAAQQ